MSEKSKQLVSLSAIEKTVVNNIPKLTEEKVRGKGYVGYGQRNLFPSYLWDLYLNIPTLQAVINGTADYVGGDAIIATREIANNTGETTESVLRKAILDYIIFGGFALQIIRSLNGDIAEVYHLDFQRVRSNEDNTVFYYAKDWDSWGTKAKVYPKFGEDDNNPTSVLYFKGKIARGTYPIPLYNAALIACELEKAINEFHLNNINNGFAANVIINFNNGQPDEKQKAEIEDDLNEKHSGFQNAGRFIISYNDSADNATTVQRLDDDQFDKKYQALSERSRDQIFTAFRANPCLFGLDLSTGFNKTEYQEAFKVFNKSVIQPLQKDVVDAIRPVFGEVLIKPFTINWDE